MLDFRNKLIKIKANFLSRFNPVFEIHLDAEGNVDRLVEKNGKIVMNIPLTVGVVGLALGPLVALVGLSAAVLGKYNIMIQNEDDGSIVDLGELNEEKLNMLKQMLTNTAKEVKDVVVDYKKDDKDITDELINEDDEDLDLNK